MATSQITPQQIAQWKLFNPQQNPLYPSPTGDPSQATPPPSSAPPASTAQPEASSAPAPSPAPTLTAATQPGQISSAMTPPQAAMPSRPRGDFDKIPEGQPGADTWSNRHNDLRRVLANLFGGIAEFGGEINHHPGLNAPFLERQAAQADAQRQYDQNLPAAQQTASLNLQEKMADIGAKQRQGTYVPVRPGGGIFNAQTGQTTAGPAAPVKPEAPHTVETGAGVFQYNDKTGKYDIPVGPPKAQAKTPSFDEQSYEEWHQSHPKGTRMQYESDKARATQKPPAEPKQMVVAPDGTVLELHPGDKVPAGSKTPSKYGEPSADEQRRADLAGNLNENFDQLEDIVKRRPELFGPLAGRWTELKGKFGSDDPDIGTLSTLEHQIGMAQISAHGMRSAHGIEGASKSILNGFHSGPAAIMAAINTARKSVGTFQNDVATAKGETQQPAAKPKGKASNDPLGIR